MGRRTKLTPETTKKLTDAIRQGATYEHACNYAGIHYGTFCEWRTLGESGRKVYSEFSDAIKKAEGDATIKWLAIIDRSATGGNWQAAAWKLERRYPEDYGRPESRATKATTADKELERDWWQANQDGE